MWVCKGTDGNGDDVRDVFDLVVNRRAAFRTETEDEFVATVSDPHVLLRSSFHRDLIARKARLNTERAAGSVLARQAMAHRDPNGLAVCVCSQLSAAAGG